MGHDFTLPFDGPFVVKPAESDTYWKHPFPTQKKAYVLQTRAEVDQVIDDIYGAGYEDSLILQDFIPGDDSFMRVVTNLSLIHISEPTRPSTSSTTSGTASSRPLRSTAARAAATITSPARGTTWPGTWWRTALSTPARP